MPPVFQLILPFQLELPFEAGGVLPRTTGKSAGGKGRIGGLERMARPKRVRRDRGSCTFSLELPMGMSVELAEGDA